MASGSPENRTAKAGKAYSWDFSTTVRFANAFSQVSELVELTHHNANHLDLGSDQVEVDWTNRFHEPEASARRSEIQKRRHERDAEFHKASLDILRRSREARFWSEERILEAIRDFHSKTGQPPSYYEFRKTKELPDYTTLWKRFGSIGVAISRALGDRIEQEKCSE